MELILIGKLVAILLLVIGNAFFVGSEVAITAARPSRIRQMAAEGHKRAAIVKLLHDEPSRFYAVTQIGITLVSMALGAVGMDAISEVIGPGMKGLFGMFGDTEGVIHAAEVTAWAISFVIVSFLHVVGGELAPKVLAYNKSIQMSCALGWIVNGLYKMWIPIIWVMNHSSNYLLIACGQGDIVGGDGHGHGATTMSRDELTMVISASTSSGSINKDMGRMLSGVFDLEEDTVDQVMVPKPDVDGLPETATMAEALSFFSKRNHRRYPIFDKNRDRVIGVMAIKQLMHILQEEKGNYAAFLKRPISDFMRRDPFILPSGTKLSQALKEFETHRRQFGMVIDEYGTMVGVLTPESITTRLVGELTDEFAPGTQSIQKLVGSQWEIAGSFKVANLEMALDFPFPHAHSDYVTIGGLMFNKLGRIPEVGDVVQLDNGRMQVLEINNMRISRVLFQRLAIDESGQWKLADRDSVAEIQEAA
ncbi:MAG: HlyC/CorC family transporter [Magnetococcales bacterium]|nr:HlyC/CorC family transporter [Magnetococcales bacterium]